MLGYPGYPPPPPKPPLWLGFGSCHLGPEEGGGGSKKGLG